MQNSGMQNAKCNDFGFYAVFFIRFQVFIIATGSIVLGEREASRFWQYVRQSVHTAILKTAIIQGGQKLTERVWSASA